MPVSHPSFRVAAVQAAPVFLNLDATIDKAIGLIGQAAQEGVELIAFPENFFPGYPFFLWLGTPAWSMQFVQRYHDNSMMVDSVEYRRLEEAAKRHNIHLSIGFSERSGGSLYMAQALISNKGVTLSTRRKLKPTLVERCLFGEGDGSDLTVVDTSLGKIGSLCCWEHVQPLTKYAMYAQHEQIHIAAWPSFSLYRDVAYSLGPEVNTAVTQTYAVEGQCFVIAPSSVVSPEMIEILCMNDDARKLLPEGGGHARIFGPDGSPLASPIDEHSEGLLLADLDLGVLSLAKLAADPAGHYSRPDVTQLLLNKSPRRPVVVINEGQINETNIIQSEEVPEIN
ncbi:carbon-nitrogen hydrolase family protein [Pseudomonas juntendi]|jgi:aliphatic nitrilase|uniref:Carbon-nitrogen hydrolase family protein n=2 Tax=Pseudomonas TaxID=286 RepID=A0ABZ2JQH1_9PSED|nr:MULTISPECIES: carbon-nitrogen hydrolase family protein [Pseudomonas]EGC00637.1 amidohydrolase [Pseudomonas sp. TJI-51]MBA6123433.1 carbon-nitrogen hydrolase family protein [Pseudomonas juntendi]MBH3371958.1 carbon-nitrogen hydrolase family protein [Pseudomonas juntendi]MBI6916326.1 carbon-nitrogen hydrolase family protein [Pseudomonas juntendi]MBS6038211.1 carbon-nitrogen hydrolase family protein [Pseudomonas sp.]